MEQVKLTEAMKVAAQLLNTGAVIYAYRDGTTIRMETERGHDPYVWRRDHWQRMR